MKTENWKKWEEFFLKPENFTFNSKQLLENMRKIEPNVKYEDVSNLLRQFKTYQAQEWHIKKLKEKYKGEIPKFPKEDN